MTERPILFSGPMVRAILAGTKTQTRRLSGLEDVNSYPGRLEGDSPLGPLGYRGLTLNDGFVRDKRAWKRSPGLYHWFLGQQPGESNPIPVRCPYGVPGDRTRCDIHGGQNGGREPRRADAGDVPVVGAAACTCGTRLWVRETFCAESLETIHYRADGWQYEDDPSSGWKPSIFMPRWASRITLEVTEVRVQRLQDISEEDIQAEGALPTDYPNGTYVAEFGWERRAFRDLWDSINAKRAPWDSNPFVWAITFRKAA